MFTEGEEKRWNDRSDVKNQKTQLQTLHYHMLQSARAHCYYPKNNNFELSLVRWAASRFCYFFVPCYSKRTRAQFCPSFVLSSLSLPDSLLHFSCGTWYSQAWKRDRFSGYSKWYQYNHNWKKLKTLQRFCVNTV